MRRSHLKFAVQVGSTAVALTAVVGIASAGPVGWLRSKLSGGGGVQKPPDPALVDLLGSSATQVLGWISVIAALVVIAAAVPNSGWSLVRRCALVVASLCALFAVPVGYWWLLETTCPECAAVQDKYWDETFDKLPHAIREWFLGAIATGFVYGGVFLALVLVMVFATGWGAAKPNSARG